MNQLSQINNKISLIVVLDNLRSLNNVGSIFRTCDIFKVEFIYLCGITAVPPHIGIHKTALGAENTVAWRYFDHTLDAIKNLRENGYGIIAVEQSEYSLMLHQMELIGEKQAFLLGNEVYGINKKIMDKCDICLEIPQFGTKNSLNVSVTAGIVLWEIIKKKII